MNYPLYVRHLTTKLQLPILNLWFNSAGNRTQDLPDTERMLYHEGYHAGLNDQRKSTWVVSENIAVYQLIIIIGT